VVKSDISFKLAWTRLNLDFRKAGFRRRNVFILFKLAGCALHAQNVPYTEGFNHYRYWLHACIHGGHSLVSV